MGKKTDMITKHNLWEEIKEDLIHFVMPKDKRGVSTIWIFLFILVAFMVIIMLGIGLFTYNTISTNLDLDQDFGAVNLKDVNQLTLGKINAGMIKMGDTIGYTILFAMVFFMMLNAYFTRDKYPKVFIIADIMMLVFAYILAVYVADTYSTFINSTTLLSVYTTTLPKSSYFLLNLPIIVGIIGAIIIILSYSGFPSARGDESFVNVQ